MKTFENHNNKQEKKAVIEWLIEHFPNAFFKNGHHVKPLQIGIFEEIVSFFDRLDTPPFSKSILKQALSYYSASPHYLKKQIPNAARVDIYGNEVDVVTESQAKYAAQKYIERYTQKNNVS